LTVFDTLGDYLEHAHEHVRPWHLVWAAQVLWSFAGQYGDLEVNEAGLRQIDEFTRQAKERRNGVSYWPRATRRKAARILLRALAWAADTKGT
jgi:hypothetical protein